MSATMMALVRRGNQARLEERPVPALLDGRDALGAGHVVHHLHQRSAYSARRGAQGAGRRRPGP